MPRSMWNRIAAIVALIGLAVGAPWLLREMRSLPDAGRLAARSGQRIVTLAVTGVDCAGCADRIAAALRRAPGVAACEARPAQERVYVVVDRTVTDSALVAVVLGVGTGGSARVVPK